MIFSKSSGTVISFSCKFISNKTTQFVTSLNDWKNGKSFCNRSWKQQWPLWCNDFLDYQKVNCKQNWQSAENPIWNRKRVLTEQFESIVSTVKFLSLRRLAFKGDDQEFWCSNNGNCWGCLELLSQSDEVLADHIIKYGNKSQGNPFYLFWTVCDKFI